MTKHDLDVIENLAIVVIDGYKPESSVKVDPDTGEEYVDSTVDSDPPGTANYLCEQYGMRAEEGTGPGILWTDYDCGEWRFSVLIDAIELDDLKAMAAEAGYTIVSVDPVTEPQHYGDGHAGTVEILKHRDGWVVIG